MRIQVQISICSSKELIWTIVSDIENSSKVFKDIKYIEIIEKPQSGLQGTKWKEVREFMGKEATETMWITEVIENRSYISEAKNSGCLYHSSIILEESGCKVNVTKSFQSTPQTFLARLMAPVMWMMKGTLKKCLMRDLEDLKRFAEGS